MAELPKGTKAAAVFAESGIVKSVHVAATAAFPGLMGIPVVGYFLGVFLDGVIKKYLAHPGVGEGLKYGLAAVYAESRGAFDREFIYLKTLDKQNSPPEVVEKALQNAENSMGVFVKRGAIK